MTSYARVVRGAEAGAIAAACVELSFFVLDSVRLQPLVTPAVLSGASLGPGGSVLDLTSLTGVIGGLWAAYQILLLTIAHFATFALVGVGASLLFDWRRPVGWGPYVLLALLCLVAFFVSVAMASSMVAISSVGTTEIVIMNVLAAALMGAVLRFVSSEAPEPEAAEG